MGHPRGFLQHQRECASYRPVAERVKDYAEVAKPRTDAVALNQASRCMDCGTPFCHWACPIGNYIPEWNDLVHNRQWGRAYELLSAGNVFPEVTGRVCPALCEYSCVLGINDQAVTVRENELDIIEHAFRHGLVKPQPPKARTGQKVAVVGSGPAGLACAVYLNRAGYLVTVFERNEKIGGLLRFGIPDFKLDKKILDRRQKIWEAEGIVFKTGVEVGCNLSAEQLQSEFDAVCLAGGASVPRDLKIPGRELQGIHFALEFLSKRNNLAAGKSVVVIGGGDTGADCVGTANRQGARRIYQLEVLPKPPASRTHECPWPKYPLLLKTTSSHEEGVERHWEVVTKKFVGKNGRLTGIEAERRGRQFLLDADLVLLAIGFTGPEEIKGFDLKNLPSNVWAAGDMRRGQSLVVWALAEGRQAAEKMIEYLRRSK